MIALPLTLSARVRSSCDRYASSIVFVLDNARFTEVVFVDLIPEEGKDNAFDEVEAEIEGLKDSLNSSLAKMAKRLG